MLPTKKAHFRFKDTYRLKLNEWKKTFHTNSNKKKAGVAVLMSDEIDFKLKRQRRLLIIKGPVHQGDIKYVNMYVPNIEALMYTKQILLHLGYCE
jgi:hypothetical protein